MFAPFVFFWTKMQVDSESWCIKLSIKQLRMKKISKDYFTNSWWKILIADFRAIKVLVLQAGVQQIDICPKNIYWTNCLPVDSLGLEIRIIGPIVRFLGN